MYRPDLIEPGDINELVRGWADYGDIRVPILRKRPERAEAPDGIPEGIDERLGILRSSVDEVLKKNISYSDATNTKRSNAVEEFTAEIEQLERKRRPLTEWEIEQINRCLHGHGYMSGRHYFYFNFCWIQEVAAGGLIKNIRPSYRVVDSMLFSEFQRGRDSRRGFVAVKRRRLGATWVSVADDLYDIVFLSGSTFFITKDEADEKKYYARFFYMHERLPDFLKGSYVRDALDIKVVKQNPRISSARGLRPEEVPNGFLRSGSAKNAANIAGETVSVLKIDEYGEMPNIAGVLAWGLPMLAASNGLDRAGACFAFGTIGEMSGAGAQAKRIFLGAEAFDLKPIFIPGWMGTYVDEFGNEDKDSAVSKIKSSIQKYEDAGLLREAHLERQKFPLDLSDAFSEDGNAGTWPRKLINIAEDEESLSPPRRRYGTFIEKDGAPVFIEDSPAQSKSPLYPDHIGYGQWIIHEPPVPGLAGTPGAYVAGADPVDMKKIGTTKMKGYTLSDISFVIYKRVAEIGGIAEFVVAEYCGRPDDPADAFEQCALCQKYYYNAKVNIERNKGNLMFSYYESKMLYDLIAFGSGWKMGLTTKASEWGFTNTPAWWQTMISLGAKWWKHHFEKPTSPRFRHESRVVSEENTDLVVAFLAALQYATELDSLDAFVVEGAEKKDFFRKEHDRLSPKKNFRSFGVSRGPSEDLLDKLMGKH